MRQSQLFGKTSREFPKDEVAINARLLSRAGFIDKVMSGVWSFLPLGYRVLNKINALLREEMNSAGGQELLLTSFQSRELWDKTGRWEDLKNVMYQFRDSSDRSMGLAITHEEPLTDLARKVISSYKDLPLYVYQIQTKFRNELRAKSGLLRGREFLMKDLYSFDRDEGGLSRSYETMQLAYQNFFKRCDLDARVVEASGGAFTKEFTHEFQVLTDAGEDEILYCTSCSFAQNKEIAISSAGNNCPVCQNQLKEGKSIEVGHIYKLGVKYSQALGLAYSDEKGVKLPVVMGSYGIGPGRVMGTIVEVHHDSSGIIWPEEVAPFQLHLVSLGNALAVEANAFYQDCLKRDIEILYDDRDLPAGEKFYDADLIGIPWRVVMSDKTLSEGKVEVKKRESNSLELKKPSDFIKEFIS